MAFFLCLGCTQIANAQSTTKAKSASSAQENLKGRVIDRNNEPLPGVIIQYADGTRGVVTDSDGFFEIDKIPLGTKLKTFMLGMQEKEIVFSGKADITVVLEDKVNELDEVTIVAFGKQKKESVISSIQTVNVKELRVPSSNLTNAFAGRIAGMISYQTSGEPGYDNADFFIRGITTFGTGKVNPLILIDNVEVSTSDLARLHPDDLQSFSVLKDATATALYGARGANGVILVTTKEGKEGKLQVNVRVENSFSSPTKTLDMADPITYMRLANEAAIARNPLAELPYSNSKIEYTMRKDRDPYVYPAVDWMDMLTKDMTSNQRANINISGGGQVARYYISGAFNQDNGVLKVDKRNNFNSNINFKSYNVRSNINLNLTKSLEAVVRVHGSFTDYNGPISGGSDMYQKILQVSPVRFPAYYQPDETYQGVNHILFGNYGTGQYMNPYAELVKGYRQESSSRMMAQIELKQNFGKWVDGLSARFLGNTERYSLFNVRRSYSPYYYDVDFYDRIKKEYRLHEINPTTGTEYLSYEPGDKIINSTFYGEGSLSYNKRLKEIHALSGMLVGTIREHQISNANTLSESLPQRNLGLAGRFTYSFDDRYFGEFNFGYNGSEKFDKGHRWGFFPSFGVGWVVSNERFWSDSLEKTISKLKIRATYGLVGNDQISGTRFFYLSDVNIGGGGGFLTGFDFNGINRNGVSVRTYSNSNVGWEIAYKSNLGIELGLLKGKIDIQADIFREHRTNILQRRADIPSTTGFWAEQSVNVGEAKGKGIDLSVDYNHSINRDAWVVGRANFTYARSIYSYFEESDYEGMGYGWLSKTGQSVRQEWGYVAERLFIDQEDIDNSPRQDLGQYMPGDIKYKDINNDNIINELDRVPIGYPNTPEINYGFGVSGGYKGFDASVFFQGSGRYSFWIDYGAMSPFRSYVPSGETKTLETGLSKFIVDDHWSQESQNPFAAWPRLSSTLMANNNARSTYFMRNGSFLRLKSAEIGYSIPDKLAKKLKLTSCRIYVSGTNLLLFSGFKLWDVEMGGSGLKYPLQKVVNAGINLSF
ncbi:SusC/RagA family TonB-linked outer membrane protein [Bacteroidia bacterium]|nr:SusC/RagA family TonB-linked outer membrane protein [Bacteroidia bacterium]GHU88260.1 SusC/RagA family TonB-linked outer membrane protein [Bacteroidia bacterium]